MVHTNGAPYGHGQFIRTQQPFNEMYMVGRREEAQEACGYYSSPLYNMHQRQQEPGRSCPIKRDEPSSPGVGAAPVAPVDTSALSPFEGIGSSAKYLDTMPSKHSWKSDATGLRNDSGYGSIRGLEDVDPIAQMENGDRTFTETEYWTAAAAVQSPVPEASTNPPWTHRTAHKSVEMATDTPLIDIGDEYIGDVDSVSDAEDSSRSPSPWQTDYDVDGDQMLVRSLEAVIFRLSDRIPSSQACSTGSTQCSEENSPATDAIEGVVTHASGPGSGSSPATGAGHHGGGSSGTNQNGKRTRNPSDPTGDPNGGDRQDPNRKRLKPATPDGLVPQQRFACPYQKFDRVGSPYCCMPSSRNPKGGADTLSRVK